MPTKDDVRVARIASLALANAMIFQEALSNSNSRVAGLRKTMQAEDFASATATEWKMIIEEIDYIPIFKIGYEILVNTSASAEVDRSLREMAGIALKITSRRAALRHDLMGRIYHLLLTDAKYFGAFYTMVPSATLLLRLAMKPEDWNIDWANPEQISKLRIADLACGTGTLLKAALESAIDNHVVACAESGERVDLNSVHEVLVENVLIGLDVLPFAVHLAATTLALHSPEVPFKQMQLYNLPLGAPSPDSARLGSIDLLKKRTITVQSDLFGGIQGPERVTGKGDFNENLSLRSLDLCVMNPPFTRSVGGNLLFGSSPPDERDRMQKALKDLLLDEKVKANATAGLGSVFVALGDSLLGREGRLALVLPKSLLSGIAWEETRELLESRYNIQYVVVSHEPDHWNFSENTELSEVLLVATKRGGDRRRHETAFVNLWRRPRNTVEALTCSNLILSTTPASLDEKSGVAELSSGLVKYGELISVPPSSWSRATAFAQTDLNRVAHHLAQGKIQLPGKNVKISIPLVELGSMADVGPDRRDIFDGFDISNHFTSYPALWGHDSEAMQTIGLNTNKFLVPLAKAKAGRPLRRLDDLWPKASTLMISERLWLNTYRLVAAIVEKPALSNVWWPTKFRTTRRTYALEKGLAIWLNSTLGLIMALTYRGDTRGAWVQLKKPVLARLPVLDVEHLSSKQLELLSATYDAVRSKPLETFARCDSDRTRIEIDNGLKETLGLPDISTLRDALAREPVLTLKPL
jgi:hypothetical protein